MQCAWDALLNLLPIRLRAAVDRQSKNNLQELRLRLGRQPELVTAAGSFWLQDTITAADIQFCINAASKYSPWAAHTTQYGYITAAGGHRIGICGEAITDNNRVTGLRNPTALCIRVARDFQGISADIPVHNSSVLILGPPGSGKTTLLRDIIRKCSNTGKHHISVVDERGELFPSINGKFCYDVGNKTDILSGCRKDHGIEMLLRCMGPSVIAVDEITAAEDCEALIQAGWCGVHLFATAHANGKDDLFSRPVYKPIVETHLFNTVVTLNPDKTWRVERMDK